MEAACDGLTAEAASGSLAGGGSARRLAMEDMWRRETRPKSQRRTVKPRRLEIKPKPPRVFACVCVDVLINGLSEPASCRILSCGCCGPRHISP